MVKMPDYPRELKDAEWQKNKGKVAKLKGKSGLGELLKKAEADYTKVIKMHHDNQIALCTDTSRVHKIEATASDAWRAFLKTLGGVQKLATKRAKEYKSSKVVGKTTRVYVESIASKADEDKKFGQALNGAHMEFVQACMAYFQQPSIIGGDIVLYMKELKKGLPKFRNVLVQLDKLNKATPKQDISAPLKKFCSSLKKFSTETSRSLGQALILYCQTFTKLKMKVDPKIAELIKPWGEHGKANPQTLEDARTFVTEGQSAYDKSLPVLRKHGFKV